MTLWHVQLTSGKFTELADVDVPNHASELSLREPNRIVNSAVFRASLAYLSSGPTLVKSAACRGF
jgi:hypothetical protein